MTLKSIVPNTGRKAAVILPVFCSLVLGLAISWPTGSAEADNLKSNVSDSTETVVEDAPEADFPVDLTEFVSTTVIEKLRSAGRKKYFVTAEVTNISDQTIPGPISLVVESTGILGVEATKFDGELENGEKYFTIVPERGELKPGQTTKVKRVDFVAEKTLSLDTRKEFKLAYRVSREVEHEQRADSSDPKQKKLPGKKYTQAQLDKVMSIQDRHTLALMKHKDIFGTATIENKNGDPIIAVIGYRKGVKHEIPASLDGVELQVIVRGPISAGQPKRKPAPAVIDPIPETDSNNSPEQPAETGTPAEVGTPNDADAPADATPPTIGSDVEGIASGSGALPTDRFDRPVPIGVSSFNAQYEIDDVPICGTGTLGFRATDSQGRKVLVSNNHVWAAENQASIGDPINQPGQLDTSTATSCASDPADYIGAIVDFVPFVPTIDPAAPNFNTIDACLCSMNPGAVLACTPADGYGFPSSGARDALIGEAVQKYGRTTGFTQGVVTAVNVTIPVNFSTGVFFFQNCIEIRSSGAGLYLDSGDSGSLTVSAPGRTPVGLNFAGGGGFGYANPIVAVLQRFDITIDSSDAGGAQNPKQGRANPLPGQTTTP